MNAKRRFNIALLGNPNCGKTTLFNTLTGSKQYVGNWPGVTVEKKSGEFSIDKNDFEIVDLPGIYSLTTYSLDEKVSRNFLIDEKPDLILNIIDASNLERNLYLTLQLVQLRKPMIIALNMIDLIEKLHIKIDIKKMTELLNCPVIPISASKKEGIEELLSIISDIDNYPNYIAKAKIAYDEVIYQSIERINPLLKDFDIESYDKNWYILRLLELDEEIIKNIDSKLLEMINKERLRLKKHTKIKPELLIADGVYGYANGLCKEIIKKNDKNRIKISDRIDSVLLSSILGLPAFILIMYIVFSFSMTLSSPFISLLDTVFGTIFIDGFTYLLNLLHSPNWLIIFLANGVGGGIQTVSTFIPPIFFIFLSLSVLEDSGYMARAAFVMDRIMHYLGLSGKSIIPMIVGFGCTVPAIMSARTIEGRRDRIMTILLVPFIQCGAKIPVYSMFTVLFFGQYAGIAIFGLYVLGILFAVLSGLLFKKFLFKGQGNDFVMELPSYHVPTLNAIFMHTWFKLKGFVLKAGKTILLVVIVLTLINSLKISHNVKTGQDDTILTIGGRIVTPLFKPMGIENENWGATVALFTGLFAKEAIVGTLEAVNLNQVVEENQGFVLNLFIKDTWNAFSSEMINAFDKIIHPFKLQDFKTEVNANHPLKYKFKNIHQVIAYLLFILIYAPCIASISTTSKEIGKKIARFQLIYLTLMAWIVATLYYQLAVFTVYSLYIITIPLVFMALLILYMKKIEIE